MAPYLLEETNVISKKCLIYYPRVKKNKSSFLNSALWYFGIGYCPVAVAEVMEYYT